MRRYAPFLAALLLATSNPAVVYAETRYVPAKRVVVTWYLPTGDAMYNGELPHVGALACSWDLKLGTVVLFNDGRLGVCKDRGLLGSSGHLDVFVNDSADGRDVAKTYGDSAIVSLFIPE